MPEPGKFDVTQRYSFVMTQLMKTLFFIVALFSIGFTLSQNKIKIEDLSRFDWVLYNKPITDSTEIFRSDTLLLIRTYDNTRDEYIRDEKGQNIVSYYPGYWELILNDPYADSTGNNMEFSIYHINLRQAAMNKKLELDSITFYLLRENLTTIAADSTLKICPVLNTLENGDIIQVTNRSDKGLYYIKKSDDQLKLLTTLNKRFINHPKGLNEGNWKLDKKRQLINFSYPDNCFGFRYKIEIIDDLRIRLIKQSAWMC